MQLQPLPYLTQWKLGTATCLLPTIHYQKCRYSQPFVFLVGIDEVANPMNFENLIDGSTGTSMPECTCVVLLLIGLDGQLHQRFERHLHVDRVEVHSDHSTAISNIKHPSSDYAVASQQPLDNLDLGQAGNHHQPNFHPLPPDVALGVLLNVTGDLLVQNCRSLNLSQVTLL